MISHQFAPYKLLNHCAIYIPYLFVHLEITFPTPGRNNIVQQTYSKLVILVAHQ